MAFKQVTGQLRRLPLVAAILNGCLVLPWILLIIAVILLPVIAAFADERLANTVVHEQDDEPPDTAGEGTLLAA